MKKNFTKTILFSVVLILMLSASSSYAQKADSTAMKNLVKWNFAALALKNYSFQYERAIGKKISVGLGFRFMPKSDIPFNAQVEDAIDDPETWDDIKDFKTGNFAITPEVRFYLGKGVFQGFYVAPFVRYAEYDADLPYHYEATVGTNTIKDKIDLNGNVKAITGGLLLGAQWKLSKRIFFDWWILGPNYGTSSGKISGKKTLSNEEQQELRSQLEDLKEDLPVAKIKYAVDGNGVTIDVDGPWAGLRAGLNIGFRF